MLPFISDFQVPGTSAVSELLKSADFRSLKLKILKDFEITVWIAVSPPETEFDFSFFFLHASNLNQEQIEEAKESVVKLFADHHVCFLLLILGSFYSCCPTRIVRWAKSTSTSL